MQNYAILSLFNAFYLTVGLHTACMSRYDIAGYDFLQFDIVITQMFFT